MNLYYAQIGYETGVGQGVYRDYYVYASSLENARYHATTLMNSFSAKKEYFSLNRLEEVTPYEGMVIG